ncbi:MAG: filamentation induced by cAMP protein Fic, partial [bacterium]
KERESNIIEKYPDGRQRIRFQTVSVTNTAEYLNKTIELWHLALKEKWVHPLITLAAFNLDFLCIHPFRDGNGRVSRLLLLLQCYQLGYEVGRYISLERLIEQNKERYYETLELSSQGWHEGKAEVWHFANYLLYILKLAYQEFEARVNQTASPKGSKRSLIESAIDSYSSTFTLSDLEKACPGVSRDMIRNVLKSLRKANKIECLGLGARASWQKRR